MSKEITTDLKREAGFTLIELVMVIVILGILAAAAAPKFINLGNDARFAVVKGIQAQVMGAANITQAAFLARGCTTGTVTADTCTVTTDDTTSVAVNKNGYPKATATGIDVAFNHDGVATVTVGSVYKPTGAADTCKVTYAIASDVATVTLNATGPAQCGAN
jgi:MSHA pilin protein MshA